MRAFSFRNIGHIAASIAARAYQEIPDQTGRVYSAEADAYATAATSVTAAHKDAIDNLVKRLKLNGVYSLIDNLRLVYGTKKGVDLISPSGTSLFTIDSGLFYQAGGYYNVSPGKTIDTNIPLSGINANDYGLFVYNCATTLSGPSTYNQNYVTDGTDNLGIYQRTTYNAFGYGGGTLNMNTATEARSVTSFGLFGFTVKSGKVTGYAAGYNRSAAIGVNSLPNTAGNLKISTLTTSGLSVNSFGFPFIVKTKGLTENEMDLLAICLEKFMIDMSLRTENYIYQEGDSISVGLNATSSSTQGWVGLLRTERSYHANSVLNAVSGKYLMNLTGRGSFKSVYEEVFTNTAYNYSDTRPFNNCFKYMIIAIGINDLIHPTVDPTNNTAANFNTQYRAYVDRLLYLGWPKSRLKLLNTYFVNYASGSNGGPTTPARQVDFNAVIAQIGADYGIQVIDVFGGMKTAYENGWTDSLGATYAAGTSLWNTGSTDDGLHPANHGHRLIADIVKATIA